MQLIKGDCLEEMAKLEPGSVDLVLTDPPYGTTACKWDSIIPLESMWEHIKRIIRNGSAIVIFGTEPFSSMLRMSNLEYFKYDWIWIKSKAFGFCHCKNAPMKKHEIISVFSGSKIVHIGRKNRMTYHPQGLIEFGKTVNGDKSCDADVKGHNIARPSNKNYVQYYTNYPSSILKIRSESNTVHPTQKPIELLEYLIKTYTNECDTVLDFTMGSGSTGVACVNTNRNFIGIEKDDKYFEIAKQRIEQHGS